MAMIDPYKLIGEPSTWGAFGDGDQDRTADAERRALAQFFIRRIKRAARKNIDHSDFMASLITGAMVAQAGLIVSGPGGVEQLPEDAFDRWIAIATFSWHQALETMSPGSGHA